MIMKKTLYKRIAAAVLVLIAAAAVVLQPVPAAAAQTAGKDAANAWPDAPSTVSGSVILIDADTGAILYEKNAYEKSYPASTTKILTGLLTIENSSMDEIVTFSNAAANSVVYGDASIGTKAGEQYTVEQALYALLLYSANEIGYGLAEHVSGSLSAFVELMNDRARELGAVNTHFANASGLHSDNHYTTAYDMAMIARGCYNNSTFVNIDSTYTTYTIPPTNMTAAPRYMSHRHQMLKNRSYYYEYCKGGKTGFTDEAGNTLVTFAEKEDMRLICVCFKSTADDRYKDTRALFDWGFTNFKKVTAAGSSVSSLFSNDSFYKSRVFNPYRLAFNLNASTLTIPNGASVSDITLDIDERYGTRNENGIYTAYIDFKYGSNTVGAATLTLSGTDTAAGHSNLPHLSGSFAPPAPAAKNCLTVNIWFLVTAGVVVLVLIYTVCEARRIKRKNMHAKRRRKLHY